MTMTRTERMDAYARLTRTLRTMHHTERTRLDALPNLRDILAAVHPHTVMGDRLAIRLTETLRTEEGEAWRAKQGLRWNNGITCLHKVGGPDELHECGLPCEYVTEQRASEEGLTSSGWHHVDRTITADHHAVPRSLIA